MHLEPEEGDYELKWGDQPGNPEYHDIITMTARLKELMPVKEFPRGHFLKVAELFVQLADAMHHAHRSGVIHCDVNPSNILLTPDFNPKVTNFGLRIDN